MPPKAHLQWVSPWYAVKAIIAAKGIIIVFDCGYWGSRG